METSGKPPAARGGSTKWQVVLSSSPPSRFLDEASKPIAKINRALKKLFETAESLKSKPINITIGDKDVQSAIEETCAACARK